MFIPKLPDILKEKKSFSGSIRLWDVGWYIRDYSIGSYNLSPSYQRPDVWSIEQRCALIRSIFFKLPIPPVVLNVLPDEIAF